MLSSFFCFVSSPALIELALLSLAMATSSMHAHAYIPKDPIVSWVDNHCCSRTEHNDLSGDELGIMQWIPSRLVASKCVSLVVASHYVPPDCFTGIVI
jgi:hypothetical protein